jgi:hypothetical protein
MRPWRKPSTKPKGAYPMPEDKERMPDACGKSNVARASSVGLLIGVGLFLAFPLPKHGIASDIVAALGIAIIAVFLIHKYKANASTTPPNKRRNH